MMRYKRRPNHSGLVAAADLALASAARSCARRRRPPSRCSRAPGHAASAVSRPAPVVGVANPSQDDAEHLSACARPPSSRGQRTQRVQHPWGGDDELMAAIMGAASCRQLHDDLLHHLHGGARVRAVHPAAALTRLPKLLLPLPAVDPAYAVGGGRTAPARAADAPPPWRLLIAAGPRAQGASPAGSPAASPPPQWDELAAAEQLLPLLMRLLRQHSSHVSPRQLANCLWGLAKLAHPISCHHMRLLLTWLLEPQAVWPPGAAPPPPPPPAAADAAVPTAAPPQRHAPKLAALSPREVSNVCWAVSAAPGAARADQWHLLAARAGSLLPDMSARDVANLALAAARLAGGAGLWSPLLSRCAQLLGSFNPQELVNLAWALAAARPAMGGADRALCAALAARLRPLVPSLQPRQVANLLWACARVPALAGGGGSSGGGDSHEETALVKALGAAAAAAADRLAPCEAAMAAWALAKLRATRACAALVEALACAAAAGGLDGFAAGELALLAWAAAMTGVRSPALLHGLCGVARARGAQLRAHEAAALLWALARLQWADLALAGEAAAVVQAYLATRPLRTRSHATPAEEGGGGGGYLSPALLSGCMHALAASGYYSAGLYDSAAERLLAALPSSPSPTIVQALSALSTARHYHPRLFAAAAVALHDRVAAGEALSAAAAAAALRAYAAAAAVAPPALAAALAERLGAAGAAACDALGPARVVGVLWAAALLQQWDLQLWGTAYAHVARHQAAYAALRLPQQLQLHQAHLIAAMAHARHGGGGGGWPLALPRPLARALCAAWRAAAAATTTSRLQRGVQAALDALGLATAAEQPLGGGSFTVDLVVWYRGRRVVLEIDGPSHFCANMLNHATGATRARHRCLRALGLPLVTVPWFELVAIRQRLAAAASAAAGRGCATAAEQLAPEQAYLLQLLDAATRDHGRVQSL